MTESWLQSAARSLICRALGRIRHGQLRLKVKYSEDGGDEVVLGPPPTADGPGAVVVAINHPHAWVRMLQSMDLGFAEAYMQQEVDCDDLLGLFCLHIGNTDALGHSTDLTAWQLLPLAARYLDAGNVVSRSRANIAFHYDESSDFFGSFLSADMNYSSALWSGSAGETLEAAQLRKERLVLERARIAASHHVLDIGCGWGHWAVEAARQTGCRVTGLTLSRAQKARAEERIAAAGLQGRVDVVLCDYREAPRVEGGYDRVVSVEMLEHVGCNFIHRFFHEISALLKPDSGLMVIQGITTHRKSSPNLDTFIGRYIFPGGYLHSSHDLLEAIHAGSQGALQVETVENIGPHYVRTLRCWRQNFLRNWPATRTVFIDKNPDATEADVEAFRRRWEYYFTYCEAGFRTRLLGDHVISAVRPFSPTNCRQLVEA
ncbi:hypothetical protein CDD83_58 [Cordyceps sp. RAO-2017]|nr:hypothetical protein CDD83_58 [Cordyceps sp. RAO-2017]